jgi:uncharacterized protein YecE (DUF72 family)
MAAFYRGTSNIKLVEKNKQAFPPEFRSKSRLAYYSSLFNSVEVNSTFYKLPLPATLERWATEVPAAFRFTLKVWREITHASDLSHTKAYIEKFMRIADWIGKKKGALLVQFPASTQRTQMGQLESILEEINKHNPSNGWQIAVEFRHRTWYHEFTYSLLDSYGAALVRHDRPSIDPDSAYERESFVYLRFHGPKGDYRGSYQNPFLHDQARRIHRWLTEGKNVYAYFNNTMQGDAPKDLQVLNKFMQAVAENS